MKFDPQHPFARYASIIDDWTAFTSALESPLQRTLWLNPLKELCQQTENTFTTNWQPLPIANAYSSDQSDLGTHWGYHAGLYHIQELVSMLPVLLLDPKPGERILDLCAAPGSKTMQIALAMQNQGTLIANDKNYSRSKALRFHLERLGIVNVTTTTYDGASFPNSAGLFDKILVDAPCSGEGTSRKHSNTWKTQQNVHNIHQLQQRILRRAIALCKPGGLILYSTCTYAPEENENVVNTALQTHPELSLLPITLPGLKISPGLTQWQDQTFAPELALTARLWPHHNNTGGFYLALLQKDHAFIRHSETTICHSETTIRHSETTIRHPEAPIRHPRESGDPSEKDIIIRWIPAFAGMTNSNGMTDTNGMMDTNGIINDNVMTDNGEITNTEITDPTRLELENHLTPFAFPADLFSQYHVYKVPKHGIYLVSQDHQGITFPKPDAVGLYILKTRMEHPKLTTAGARLFGHLAQQQYIELNAMQIQPYLQREDIIVTAEQIAQCPQMGYVIVRYQGLGIGVGLLLNSYSPGEWRLRSLYPKV